MDLRTAAVNGATVGPDPSLSGFADMRRRLGPFSSARQAIWLDTYDFYAYAAFALYFAKSFFPEGDETAQQLNARAMLFAAGFLAVPWAAGCSAISPTVMGGAFLTICSARCVWARRHRRYAHLRDHRRHGARRAGAGPGPPGPQPRRPIGTSATYLSEVADEKNRRILLELPICH